MDWQTALREAGYLGEMTIKAVAADCNLLWGKSRFDHGIACLILSGPTNRPCGGYLEDGVFRLCGEAETEEEALTLLWCDLRWRRNLKDAGYKGKFDLSSLIELCPVAMREHPEKPMTGFVLKRLEPEGPYWQAGYPHFLWGAPWISAEGAVAGLWHSLAVFRKTA